MIDLFPLFSKLELKHKPSIDAIVSRLPPYSDFNFISLYSWNTDDSTYVSMLNGNLVIKQLDYVTGKPVLSLLGKNKIDESLASLLKASNELKLVPELTVESINNPQLFTIIADRDNHDYVYALSEMVGLSGEKFKKIRNKLNKFTSVGLMHLEVVTTDTIAEVEKQEFILLFDAWAKTAKQSKEDSATEKIAFIRLLGVADSLPLLFTTVRQASNLIALHISENLENKYAICHFEKALSIYENLTTFAAHEGAKALLDKGIQFANWEQDLGLEGLRQAKSKWQPASFLKKYTIRLKD